MAIFAGKSMGQVRDVRDRVNEGPTDDELKAWKRSAASRGDGEALMLIAMVQNVRLIVNEGP